MLPTLPNKDITWCNDKDLIDEYVNLVLFHHPCNDGFAAALMAWISLPIIETLFVPMNYNDPLPEELYAGKYVYILDFSVSVEKLADIKSKAKFVVWLDHHESAMIDHFGENHQKEIELREEHIYYRLSSTNSGALLANCYFLNLFTPYKFSELISDRDLWTFNLKGTKELHAYLATIPMTFEAWNNVSSALEYPDETEKIIDTGAKLLLQYENYVNQHLSKFATRIDELQRTFAFVNCSPMFSSDLGNKILEQNPAIDYCVLFNLNKEDLHVSLRSRKGGVNVAEIAKQNGGGGHQAAAGFIVPKNRFNFTFYI